MEASTVTPTTQSLCLSPDAKIQVLRPKDIVLIVFLDEKDQPQTSLDPQLAGHILVLATKLLPKRKLLQGMNLATISWSTVCLLAQLGIGGAVAMRAVEQNQQLPVPTAQLELLQLVAALNRTVSIDPFKIGQALSTCMYALGNSVSDVHQVTEPLRRTPELSAVVLPR